MEYYSSAKGAPSSFAGLGSSASDPTAGTGLNSLPLYEDWRLKHGAPSPGSTSADAGPEGMQGRGSMADGFLPSCCDGASREEGRGKEVSSSEW